MYKRDGAGFDPTTINLSNNPSNSAVPEIAAIGSNVYVVWVDGVGIGGNNEILYRMSTDGGATFGSTINLSNNGGFSWLPKVAVSGNNVYVVWEDDTTGNDEILFRRSVDGGATFGSTINLSSDSGDSLSVGLAVSGSNVYVVWVDSTGGNNEILFRMSTDGGITFGDITNISNNPGFSQLPRIAVFGTNLYVIWVDVVSFKTEIFYRRSVDGGASFSDTENLSNNADFSDLPAVTVLGNDVYVVWEDNVGGLNREIFYRRSTDGGASFSDTENLSNSPLSSESPAIAVLGNNVYFVWKEFVGGTNNEILYRRSTDGGTLFDPVLTNISNNPAGSIAPAISVS